jgi:hypothetical protein
MKIAREESGPVLRDSLTAKMRRWPSLTIRITARRIAVSRDISKAHRTARDICRTVSVNCYSEGRHHAFGGFRVRLLRTRQSILRTSSTRNWKTIWIQLSRDLTEVSHEERFFITKPLKGILPALVTPMTGSRRLTLPSSPHSPTT